MSRVGWFVWIKPLLVGGWTHPVEKYARQNGFIFPNFRGENRKYLKPPTRWFGGKPTILGNPKKNPIWNHHLVYSFPAAEKNCRHKPPIGLEWFKEFITSFDRKNKYQRVCRGEKRVEEVFIWNLKLQKTIYLQYKMYKWWFFSLDDEPNLDMGNGWKWLDITKNISKNCLFGVPGNKNSRFQSW